MTSSPLALALSSQLIQDYLYLDDPPPPALRERGSLVAVTDGLLAIDGEKVMHYALEPASEGGWRTTTIDVPVPPTAANADIMMIKAFELDGNKDGVTGCTTLNLLCFYVAQGWEAGGGTEPAYAVSWLVREIDDGGAGGTWQNALLSTEVVGLLSQVQSLDVFDAGLGKGKFVYGLTTDMLGQDNAQIFTLKMGNYNYITTLSWTMASRSFVPDMFGGGRTRVTFLASGSADQPRSVSLCYDSIDGGTTLAWTYPLSVDEEFGPDLAGAQIAGTRFVDGTLQEFVPIDGLDAWTAVGVDGAGLVYQFQFYPFPAFGHDVNSNSNQMILNLGVGPTNVTAVSVTRRTGESVSLFAVGDGRLWLTRDISNVNWVDLGDPVSALTTPSYDPTVFEVYYADATDARKNRIYHLSQDGAQSVWKRQKLATFTEAAFVPSGSGPTEVGTITIELGATHQASGRAAGSALVNVTSDQWTVLLANGASYWVGPGRDQQIPADEGGLVTLRYQALDLKFPHLTFYATEQGLPNSATVGCRGDVIDGDPTPSVTTVANRLAGNDKTGKFAMTTANLQKANLLPGTSDDDKTANCIRQLGTYMVQQDAKRNGASLAEAQPAKTWTFRKTEAGYTCEETHDEVLADSVLGSFWSDVGDGLNWIKHTAEDVGDFVVKVEGDVVKIAVAGLKLAVRTARQAADAIGTIFAKVMAGIRELEQVLKDLVKFLKMLFEWGDIIDTHNALKTMINWGINYVPANRTKVTGWIDQNLNGFADTINDAITAAEHQLKKSDIRANAYAASNNLTTPGDGGPMLAGGSYGTHFANHKSRCTYVISKARAHAPNPIPGGTAASGASVHDVLKTNFNKQGINDQKGTFRPAITSVLTKNGNLDFANIFDASALKLLQICKEIISASVEGFEAVLAALLAGIGDAASWVSDVLNKPIDIPVLSWLYSALVEETPFPSRNDLTILDVVCLIAAAPSTILYKLVRNDEAPFGNGRVGVINQAFGDPGNTNLSALAAFGGATLLAVETESDGEAESAGEADSEWSVALEVFGIYAGCLNIFAGYIGWFNDGMAMLNSGADEPIVVPYQPLFAWGGWLLSTAATLYSAPIQVLADLGDHPSPTDIAHAVFYATECLPNVADLINLTQTMIAKVEDSPTWGPYAEGGLGFIILGAAIAYVVVAASENEDGPWDYINALVSNVARPTRIMMPWGVGDPATLTIICAIILAGDTIGTLGGTATQIGSSVRG